VGGHADGLGGDVRDRMARHPNLWTWLALAVGMELILVWSAKDQEFTAPQWWWLSVATILLAGACAWIISWETDDADDGDAGEDAAAKDGAES
jgi:hypothetical protein